MTNIVQINDWEDKILENVPWQFKSRLSNSGNIRSFYIAFGAQMQDLENAIWGLIEKRKLANATKNMLERIGSSVGEPRPISGDAATDDDVYKSLVIAKIAQNSSYSTNRDVYNVLSLLGAEAISITELYPAELSISYNNANTFLAGAEVLAILRKVTAPITIEAIEHDDEVFGFEGDMNNLGFEVGKLAGGV